MGNLTTAKAKSVGPGRHSDGDGLILFVTGKKGRSWVLRAQVAGERKDIGLGSFLADPPFDKASRDLREQTPLFERPSLTLAEARLKAAHFRGLLKAGRNPVIETRKEIVIIPVHARECDLADHCPTLGFAPSTPKSQR
jgi:hypothetical protein